MTRITDVIERIVTKYFTLSLHDRFNRIHELRTMKITTNDFAATIVQRAFNALSTSNETRISCFRFYALERCS